MTGMFARWRKRPWVRHEWEVQCACLGHVSHMLINEHGESYLELSEVVVETTCR